MPFRSDLLNFTQFAIANYVKLNDLAGHELRISSSIGIAVFPEHGNDESMLIKNADQAMYQAKQCGGCSLVSYGELARAAPAAGATAGASSSVLQ